MGQSNINLAALIGSRICHDLISPIGAINNGLELLGMSDAREGPELDLISESVGNASARIRFFRIAYGAASDQSLGRAEVVSILADSMRGERLKVVYGPLDPQPRWGVRMAFLAVQCLETSLPYGGRIEIACSDGAWDITGHSAKQSVDTGLWGLLRGHDVQELAPAHVQFALLHEVSKDADRSLNTELTPERLSIRF
ncbi:histidine phosphotransferase family protein [Tateyamaria omphalii]|uniref:Histidine phosphotransferase n=1 Tax=Tateyamaria omphalii TaxID=299262 RepID=A0A1P8MTY3_9RHOB|nr:histidine phosphotransferase family protein [Tateyamaria omphalii]APX11491.1 histidine phosphotransferase [Tateyamaria omphalii]